MRALRWDDALENLELAIILLRQLGRETAALRIELRLQDARREARRAVDSAHTREAAAGLNASGQPEAESAAIIDAMAVWPTHLGKLVEAGELARLA